jgi:hypothetical protein
MERVDVKQFIAMHEERVQSLLDILMATTDIREEVIEEGADEEDEENNIIILDTKESAL